MSTYCDPTDFKEEELMDTCSANAMAQASTSAGAAVTTYQGYNWGLYGTQGQGMWVYYAYEETTTVSAVI
ncbi:hypothetical protein SARC_00575 [Sphaeroforma arctica JP610]|uniref:Uncharacterized protein n=1 Tax=Sphaeroforma arctica JP610 TaxID=667725 RepID=A0A0L0GEH2_9EUKA|nr:hypothetical protein SARC_00575 [Sphaeroforma arctica JP610]KNC87294.1 hypothetical protein SARC_00575 [Sphaeroforma arctica JP610]|eukprot:XP_014161196.1 hypothetical protein SARC_00575 [Sphaeroforma arctica JP610]